MDQPTKNGLPWTGIYRFPDPVDPEYIKRLQKIWSEEDWGENYENNRRSPFQSAIYPSTRRVAWNINVGSPNKEFGEMAVLLAESVGKQFPMPMTLLFAEMVLLVPDGMIPWHHDRMMLCHLSTRVMVPLTDHPDDIEYYFTSWNENTPDQDDSFRSVEHLNDDLYVGSMQVGNYYAYNNRVPHATFSKAKKPRGLIQMDMLPTEVFDNFELLPGKTIRETTLPVDQGGVGKGGWTKVWSPVTTEEKLPIMPCEMRKVGPDDVIQLERSQFLGTDELIARAKIDAEKMRQAAIARRQIYAGVEKW